MNLHKLFGNRLRSHTILLFTALLSAALLSSGCAGQQSAAPVTEAAAETEETVVRKAAAEAAESSETEAETEASDETAAETEAKEPASTEAAKESAKKPAKETEAEAETLKSEKSDEKKPDAKDIKANAPVDEKASDIENNGGYFVKKGDYVYFRVYGEDALPSTALWANFMQPVVGSTSSVWRLDLKTNQYEKLFDDGGYGGLWFFQDALWLNRETEFGNIIYTVDLNTYETHDLDWGVIKGISPDGSHLVYEGHTEDARQAYFVTGKEDMDNVVSATENEVLSYCGVIGRDLFFLARDYGAEEEHDELWQLKSGKNGEDGKLIRLGVFPDEEYSSAQFVQFLPGKDKVYVSVEYREGTGHFYAGSHYVSAVPGKEDSMVLLDEEAAAAGERIDAELETTEDNSPVTEDPGTLNMYLDPSGKPAFSKYAANHTALRYNEGAFDLVLYDSPDTVLPEDAVTIFENWLPEFEYMDENDISCNAQVMEYVGGRVFTIYTESTRAPEEDIGWRTSYRLQRTNYEYFDPADASDSDTGALRHIDTVETARFLTPEEVTDLNKKLDPGLNGFFLSDYRDPAEIKWFEVFYNGAGIDVQLNQKQTEAFLKAIGEEELMTDVTAVHEKDVRDFVKKTTGTSYDDAKYPLSNSWTAIPDSDLYAYMHGDTNYQSISFINGWDLGNDTYRLHYTVSSPDHDFDNWPYKVTFRIDNGQWVFISNLPE